MIHVLKNAVNILQDVTYDGVVPVHSQLEVIHSLLIAVLTQQLLVLHGEPVQVVFSLVDGGYGMFFVSSKCVDNFLKMEPFLQLFLTLFAHGECILC